MSDPTHSACQKREGSRLELNEPRIELAELSLLDGEALSADRLFKFSHRVAADKGKAMGAVLIHEGLKRGALSVKKLIRKVIEEEVV